MKFQNVLSLDCFPMVAPLFLLLFPQVYLKLSKSAEFINLESRCAVEVGKSELLHRGGNRRLLSCSDRLPTCKVRKQVPLKLFNSPSR